MPSNYNVGDQIKAKAFVDCFGKSHAEVTGLVVTSVQEVISTCLIERLRVPTYYRLTAHTVDPNAYINMVEGAERFFERA